jgi:hypothetical protein
MGSRRAWSGAADVERRDELLFRSSGHARAREPALAAIPWRHRRRGDEVAPFEEPGPGARGSRLADTSRASPPSLPLMGNASTRPLSQRAGTAQHRHSLDATAQSKGRSSAGSGGNIPDAAPSVGLGPAAKPGSILRADGQQHVTRGQLPRRLPMPPAGLYGDGGDAGAVI